MDIEKIAYAKPPSVLISRPTQANNDPHPQRTQATAQREPETSRLGCRYFSTPSPRPNDKANKKHEVAHKPRQPEEHAAVIHIGLWLPSTLTRHFITSHVIPVLPTIAIKPNAADYILLNYPNSFGEIRFQLPGGEGIHLCFVLI